MYTFDKDLLYVANINLKLQSINAFYFIIIYCTKNKNPIILII